MDVIAPTLGDRAARTLGQPFVIENRPGAGGNIGADYVAKSPADGYTIMITSIGMATNKWLYGRLSYDPVKDFAPISLLAVVPNVLVVNAAANPDKSVKDVIAHAKREPGKLTYASAGNGTSIHLAGEVFASSAGINLLHVPYKGSGPAITDILGGQVDLMFDSITSGRPHIQSGKLRALGVTSARRSATLPDVPTIAEAGVPGYEASPWFAVFAPAGRHAAGHREQDQRRAAGRDEGAGDGQALRGHRRRAHRYHAAAASQAPGHRTRPLGQGDPGTQHQAGLTRLRHRRRARRRGAPGCACRTGSRPDPPPARRSGCGCRAPGSAP
ncbi:MAG: hypothetical protein GAK38_00236 [Xylophilus sp.]|nr:MAG: hypothetical protein GAK38_00236 [Xylophilus sp.]